MPGHATPANGKLNFLPEALSHVLDNVVGLLVVALTLSYLTHPMFVVTVPECPFIRTGSHIQDCTKEERLLPLAFSGRATIYECYSDSSLQ